MKKKKPQRKESALASDKQRQKKLLGQAEQPARDVIQQVDFPQFVSDLLKGVFDANLEVTLKQMESYQQLLETATASISKFVRYVDNDAVFGYLAENNSDEFSLVFCDNEKDETGQPNLVLTDKDRNAIDINAYQIKAKIKEAKIVLATEQRELLRETILMGVSRLVVKKPNDAHGKRNVHK